jgi:bifunctional DNase/RNase
MRRWMLVVSLAAACGGAGAQPAARTAPRSWGAADDGGPRLVPDGYVRMEARDVVSIPQGGAVLLVDPEGALVLPIAIGGTEALSIALRLNSQPAPRPLTHDLLDSVIRQLGGELVKVQVDRVEGGVFIGSIYIRTASGLRRIDARPSDAIALAIGNRVPIYVARAVLDQSGVKPSGLEGSQA